MYLGWDKLTNLSTQWSKCPKLIGERFSMQKIMVNCNAAK